MRQLNPKSAFVAATAMLFAPNLAQAENLGLVPLPPPPTAIPEARETAPTPNQNLGGIKPNIQTIKPYDVLKGPLKPDGTPMFDPIPRPQDDKNLKKFIEGMTGLFEALDKGLQIGDKISSNTEIETTEGFEVVETDGYDDGVSNYLSEHQQKSEAYFLGAFNYAALKMATDYSTFMTERQKTFNDNPENYAKYATAQGLLLVGCKQGINAVLGKSYPDAQGLINANINSFETCVMAYKNAVQVTQIIHEPKAWNTTINAVNCYLGKQGYIAK